MTCLPSMVSHRNQSCSASYISYHMPGRSRSDSIVNHSGRMGGWGAKVFLFLGLRFPFTCRVDEVNAGIDLYDTNTFFSPKILGSICGIRLDTGILGFFRLLCRSHHSYIYALRTFFWLRLPVRPSFPPIF